MLETDGFLGRLEEREFQFSLGRHLHGLAFSRAKAHHHFTGFGLPNGYFSEAGDRETIRRVLAGQSGHCVQRRLGLGF